ncbi:MAG TPA: NlpC/P60 family protein [Acidimicrobiales bacterium]|nr:NlpC/P60 family protein [Acidimicrobiales bacterium]
MRQTLHALPRLRAVAILSVVVALLPTLASPARADEISDKRAQAQQIASDLEAQDRQMSVLAEQYDQAQIQVQKLQERQATAEKNVADTDAQVSAIRARLKGQSVVAYMRGGSSPALQMLASTKSTDDLAVRGTYVRAVTASAGETLDALREARKRLDEEQAALRTSREQADNALKTVDAKRAQAQALEKQQRDLLAKTQGELAALVQAEQERRAAEEAARVQAELAARKAREDAAAAAAARARAATTTTTTAPASPLVTQKPATTTTTAPPSSGGSPAPAPSNAPPPSSGASAAVAEAQRQLGKPYQWGAAGPDSFDCSGLTMWAWRAGGKSLPHSTYAQWDATSRVAISDLQPGDLVFFGSDLHHMGIYVGNGQMIEAPHTGAYVRYASIFRSDLYGAGRVN